MAPYTHKAYLLALMRITEYQWQGGLGIPTMLEVRIFSEPSPTVGNLKTDFYAQLAMDSSSLSYADARLHLMRRLERTHTLAWALPFIRAHDARMPKVGTVLQGGGLP